MKYKTEKEQMEVIRKIKEEKFNGYLDLMEHFENPSYNVLKEACKVNQFTLKYLKKSQQTEELCELAIERFGNYAFQYIKPGNFTKRIQSYMKINPKCIRYIPTDEQLEESVKYFMDYVKTNIPWSFDKFIINKLNKKFLNIDDCKIIYEKYPEIVNNFLDFQPMIKYLYQNSNLDLSIVTLSYYWMIIKSDTNLFFENKIETKINLNIVKNYIENNFDVNLIDCKITYEEKYVVPFMKITFEINRNDYNDIYKQIIPGDKLNKELNRNIGKIMNNLGLFTDNAFLNLEK